MDFDFNVILVPATLIFGFIWLLDILWLKQHKRAKAGYSKAGYSKAGQDHLITKKNAYIKSLKQHGMIDNTVNVDPDAIDLDAIKTEDAPIPVKQAEREYREAKRQAVMAHTSPKSKSSNEHFLIRWAHDYFPVLAIVLIIRSFIVEPFNIPSSSMVPTLYTGDFVAVNKYAYGIRLPLTYNKVVDIGNPQHGDVVVFRYPENPKRYYIKRVIGLPGDTVSYDRGQLSINGKPVPSEPVDFKAEDTLTNRLYTPGQDPISGRIITPEEAIAEAQLEESVAKYYKEKLGDHTYLRRYLGPPLQTKSYASFLGKPISHDSQWSVKVTEGNYFVMGDNSDRSEDGRYWGFVPDENLAGKAVYVWMHKKPGLSNLPTFKYNRSID